MSRNKMTDERERFNGHLGQPEGGEGEGDQSRRGGIGGRLP